MEVPNDHIYSLYSQNLLSQQADSEGQQGIFTEQESFSYASFVQDSSKPDLSSPEHLQHFNSMCQGGEKSDNYQSRTNYMNFSNPCPLSLERLPALSFKQKLEVQCPRHFVYASGKEKSSVSTNVLSQFHFAPVPGSSVSSYNAGADNSDTFDQYPSSLNYSSRTFYPRSYVTSTHMTNQLSQGMFYQNISDFSVLKRKQDDITPEDIVKRSFIKKDNSSNSNGNNPGGDNSCVFISSKSTGGVSRKTANEWYLIDQTSLPADIDVAVTIYNYKVSDLMSDTMKNFLEVEQKQCRRLADIILSEPVTHAYNPLVYAFETHMHFLQKYCNSKDKHVLFLGMNPGPFGMAQNGVPFGEASVVRDWLRIQGRVYKPLHEHPKRPVWGLACGRAEISGKRFWGLFQKLCGQPENFFRHCFVHNLCPMSFMNSSGKNITQPELTLETRKKLNEVCDDALVEIISVLRVKIIICLGRFVESRVKSVLKRYNKELGNVQIACMFHPSPLNRSAHSMGWENLAFEQLKNLDVLRYLQENMTNGSNDMVLGNSEIINEFSLLDKDNPLNISSSTFNSPSTELLKSFEPIFS